MDNSQRLYLNWADAENKCSLMFLVMIRKHMEKVVAHAMAPLSELGKLGARMAGTVLFLLMSSVLVPPPDPSNRIFLQNVQEII